MATGNLVRTLLLVALTIASGCQGYKPLVIPDKPELIVNEGETLEITCTSIGNINVFYPEDDNSAGIITSEHEIIPGDASGGSVKLKFRRNETIFGDTGWYGCADTKAQITEKGHRHPNASWIYVYVRSNESVFVNSIDMHTAIAEVGEELILPCRPTSPELHVDLLFNDKEVDLGENLLFDPKVGFIMKNLTAKESGYYVCQIKHGDAISEQYSFVKFIQKNTLKTPVIVKDGLEHVTKGSSLRVKCTASIGIDNSYAFFWITPRNSTSRQIVQTKKRIEANTYLATSELIEENVTYDDEGEYICQVKAYAQLKSTSTYIHVYDPNIKYINLTSHDENRHYVIHAFKPVTFSAYVNGFPKPTVLWLNPDGKEISSGNRFIIETTNTSTTLKIKSVQFEDMGTYVLQAVNEAKIEHLNFTLDVLVKPYAILRNVEHFYGVNERAEFICSALSNPVANITWVYYKCQNFTSMDNCEKIELQGSRVKDQTFTSIDASIEMNVEMSGKINCIACNIFGCDSVDQNILVSDGVADAALGIIEPEQKITVGDDITVVCAASIYNFSTVEWMNERQEPIQSTDRVKITFENTDFTHRTNLTISNVQKSDEAEYTCEATTTDNLPDKVHYQLLVNDPEPPHFINVNMNGSEATITSKESYNVIHLLCFARGMPKPSITWYWNDEPLEITEPQFALASNDQELIIKFLREKDSGKYSCKVKNRFGEITESQKFLVKGSEVSMIWIAIVVGLVIILIAVLIYFCIKIRRERKMRKELLEAGLMHFEEGALDCINPDLTVDDQAEHLPYDRKWEFPIEKLKLGRQLGKGAFGVVMKAQARGILADESVTTVAVKMVHRNADPPFIRALASELKIMVHLGKHLNVVNLLGACTNNIAKRELLVIVEYCKYGNLHNYLLRHRDNFINQIDPVTGRIDPSIGTELLMRSTSVDSSNRVKYAALSFSRSLSGASGNSAPGTETVIYCTDTQDVTGLPEGINSNGSQPGWRSNYRGDYKDRNLKPICTQDLLSWAFQVARGMEYLCQRKVLHGDLAARNILLAENNVVKICDFGLAKTMYKEENYKKKGDSPVPIKWMAIESIRDRVFSTQSDIWSFGIVLWEFFTLAETPYPGMEAEIQYQKLADGYRMEQPQYATEEIYNIMKQCWKASPTQRPSFTELVEGIGDLLEEGVKTHYMELNAPYMDMNTLDLEGKSDYLAMMSAPDHTALASPQHDYVNSPSLPTDSAYLSMNSPVEESEIFSPRPLQPNTRFQFPSSPSPTANATNSDGEDAPMLKKTKAEPEQDEDNYLKPIDVHKKREEFVRQREAEKQKERVRSGRSTDRDSGYCNTPKGLELVDVKVEAPSGNRSQNWRDVNETNKSPVILRTQDNYVNMPKQKTDLRKDVPDSFTNPSYIFVEANKSNQDVL